MCPMGDSDWWLQRHPVRRVQAVPDVDRDQTAWPFRIPAVAQLLDEGLDLGPVTVLVGGNGQGKSTIVEAFAVAAGLNAEGGTLHARHETRSSESPLHEHLALVRTAGANRSGFFLRAETMHGLFSYIEAIEEEAGEGLNERFHERSHGESFLALMDSPRFWRDGLFLFDEPESALSFDGQLVLLGALIALTDGRASQIILATHSPVLAALPGATILELDADGFHEAEWEKLHLVDSYRRFLDAPSRFLRYLS